MKKNLILTLAISLILWSCENDDEASVQDLDAPVIAAAEGRDAIRPRNGEIWRATIDHMHVRYSVADATGIQQIRLDIHSAFDGHTHGRTNNEFEPLLVLDIIEADGATFVNRDGHDTDIYWGGPSSRVSTNVLAGPYDFALDATDIHGNVTSVGAGSSYVATFYIETAYAPQMEITNLDGDDLEGEPGEALEVLGRIFKGDHNLSADISFLWVQLVEEDDHDHAHGRVLSGEVYERMWGTSQWRQHSNGNFYSGDALPNTTDIDLATIFSGDNAIMLPEEDEDFELIIWVEDTNGNVTRRKYEVHAH